MRFSLLQSAPALTLLRIDSLTPTKEQMDALRSLTQLVECPLPQSNNAEFTYLLRIPHALQWRMIRHSWIMLDPPLCTLLTHLPSLTYLSCYIQQSTCNLSFFTSLSLLTDLSIGLSNDSRSDAELEHIVESIRCCTRLSKLMMCNNERLTSQHMAAILTPMTQLHQLHLSSMRGVASLAFLSCVPHLTRTHSLHLRTLH